MKIVTDETGLVLTPQDSRPIEVQQAGERQPEPKRAPQPTPAPRKGTGSDTGRKAA
jgi:hypothetical protein